MVYSGAPIDERSLRRAMRLFGCEFVQVYGMTEATGAFAQLGPAEHENAELLRSAGRPYPWVETRIVSTESGTDLPAGAIGEIWTRSEQNLVGYYNQPQATEQALTPDGWLRTGDLGYRDGCGHLFLVDRAKDLIISGGENVYPGEVETVMSSIPDLAQVAVIGVPSERWGETVKAIVVPKPGATIDANELIAFARARLAGFKCPTSVDVVDDVPMTATGKIQKSRLRDRYWAGRARRIN
jgi:long-chain acyl-CoA synthetase